MSKENGAVSDPTSAETFPQLIRAAAAAYGDDTAIIFRPEDGPDETISFRELDERSAELARGLIAKGVGKGSRVRLHFRQQSQFPGCCSPRFPASARSRFRSARSSSPTSWCGCCASPTYRG
ncbi:MAG: AMP-binding protein [Novosphingobium sp.]